METSANVLAAYKAALPNDPRVVNKTMFGMPCAFVNRQMFFGIFEESVVVRVGPVRVGQLVALPGMRVFVPSENRPWHDYVQVDAVEDAAALSALATEALAWAAKLPLKGKKPRVRSRPVSPG